MVCKECSLIDGNRYNGLDYGNDKAELLILRPYPTTLECSKHTYNSQQNKMLINILKKFNLTEEDYLITSLVNCYPNSQIQHTNIEMCSRRLTTVIKTPPLVIMTLGVDVFNYITKLDKLSMLDILHKDWTKSSTVIHNEEIRDDYISQMRRLIYSYRENININFK